MVETEAAARVSADRLHRQIVEIATAWGTAPDEARIAADVLVAADLMGVDSHGVALLPLYEEQIGLGRASPRAELSVVRDMGAVAVFEAGAGFGQVPGVKAADTVIERASKLGLAAAAVRNSNHYGAAGVYARRIAEAGLIGISTSNVWSVAIVPTGGRRAMLGTNPFAFAAPSASGRPFLLDMATSTVAIGKLKLAERAETPLPDGWALDTGGRAQNDPGQALVDRLLSPLGGARSTGGHKGYGLACMAEILSAVLAGAAITPMREGGEAANDVGHFFLAIDPGFFREDRAAFEADMEAMAAALRATPPADPEHPVLVAGDPEYAREAERRREGIPLPEKLARQIEAVAGRAGAPFLLGERA